MKNMFTLATALALMSGAAQAQATSDSVINDLRTAGYTRVEVTRGPTQMKVEAIRGTEKVEMIIDRATGAVLKSESESTRAFENTAPGVSVRDRARDFARVASAGDDGHRRGRDDDRDDDRRGGRDDDRDDDHGGDRGRSGDDDSGHHSGYDDSGHHGGDGHGGRGGDD